MILRHESKPVPTYCRACQPAGLSPGRTSRSTRLLLVSRRGRSNGPGVCRRQLLQPGRQRPADIRLSWRPYRSPFLAGGTLWPVFRSSRHSGGGLQRYRRSEEAQGSDRIPSGHPGRSPSHICFRFCFTPLSSTISPHKPDHSSAAYCRLFDLIFPA